MSENDYIAVCACPNLLSNAIKNGTVLPKHGDLVDRSEIEVEEDVYNQTYIIHAPTILEATGTETWNGFHGQITAPKGTFKKIWNDATGEQE